MAAHDRKSSLTGRAGREECPLFRDLSLGNEFKLRVKDGISYRSSLYSHGDPVNFDLDDVAEEEEEKLVPDGGWGWVVCAGEWSSLTTVCV